MFLKSARAHFNLLANIWSSQYGINIDPTTIVKQIPVTQEAVFHQLGLEPEMTDQICCKKCFALYPMDSKQNKCTKPFLSSAQLFNQWAEAAKVVPHCDQDLQRTSSEQKQKPLWTFTYMTLKAWLSVRLLNPQFESSLDSSLSATRWEDGKEMEDVWRGRVWQEFANNDNGSGIFTQHSGNLVFSLYLNWFNAEGASNLGKHNSLGAITLVCLKLPPTQCYKVQNMFLFGIIPGPTEPSLKQVNHLLRPLVEELKLF
jgi:hypothetical protein